MNIFAIGDIHGCLKQLVTLQDKIFNYPQYNKEEDLSCSETGIIAPVAGVIGALQALEAIKKITHLDVDEDCTLKEFNLLTGRIRRIKVKKNPRCRICGEG